MQITKPLHNRYVLSCLDNETYVKYSTVYAGCKRCGVRGIYTFLGGTGLWGVIYIYPRLKLNRKEAGLSGEDER